MIKYIPNILTFLRLLMIPFYFVVFYSGNPNALRNAMIVYIVASITDVVDGYIARKYDAQSTFGMIADPFADKLLQLSVIYTLSDTHYLERWFFWLILAKEIIQVVVGAILASTKIKIVIPSNIFGKATTVFIFITILLAIFEFEYILTLQIIVAILAVITFSQYAYHVIRALQARNQST